MQVNWLLDGDLFATYRDELLSAIHSQGHVAKVISAPSPPFRWDDVGCSYRETFAADACVVAHGDIELMTRIRNEGRWTPGAFCAIERFFCSHYACHLGKYLLNQRYMMLPFGELVRCQDFLFDSLGTDDRLFIRPDSPLKLFTGQVVSRSSFAADLEFMAFYEFPASEIVLVSAPQQVVCEWRFVVSNGRVVTGCHYKQGSELISRAGYDQAAFELATVVASQDFQPDPVWVVDICQTADHAYHLLEIGGFSFSDLYACDMQKVVSAVSAEATVMWEAQQTGR